MDLAGNTRPRADVDNVQLTEPAGTRATSKADGVSKKVTTERPARALQACPDQYLAIEINNKFRANRMLSAPKQTLT